MQPMIDFLQQAQADAKPFFLWYAPFLPHAPHDPPERLLEKYRPLAPTLPIAKYWAMCEWFDETCGTLLTELDQRSLRENTIVVYVTDNGWINLAHQSAFAPRSKRSPNEGGIRTPIMIRYPAKLQATLDTSTCVSSLDILPTLLHLCQLAPPDGLPGINLVDPAARNARPAVAGEIYDHDVSDLANPAASLQYQWIICPPYKLIVPSERMHAEQAQLFDIFADPAELTELSNKYPDEVKKLRQELQRQLNSVF